MELQIDEQFTVAGPDAGVRLDRLCASRLPGVSRSQVQRFNAEGYITVDERRRPDSHAVVEGEHVRVRVPRQSTEDGAPQPQDIPLDVVYEDDHLAVINKAAGIVVHPAHGNPDGTLVNALLGRGTQLATLGGPTRPGIVHRLDKDTSGLMVVAKTDQAYTSLAAAIKRKQLEKTYHALVWGHLETREITVAAPIARHPVHRQRMAVAERGGKDAVSQLFVVDSYTHFDYIRVITFTGRTHQIRVHLSHLGHPLLGDPVYGGRKKRGQPGNTKTRVVLASLLGIVRRHALHASRLAFSHPVTGDRMRFTAALPVDMRFALETLYREDRIKEV